MSIATAAEFGVYGPEGTWLVQGFLVVIKQLSADKYEVGEKIETAKQAKTSLFDPESSRLYLAVPRQPEKEGPEIRVYKVKD
jgi:hypothetical protein